MLTTRTRDGCPIIGARMASLRFRPGLAVGHGLAQSSVDALTHGVSFGGKVMGRFDISAANPAFHQHAKEGIPYLHMDMAKLLPGGGPPNPHAVRDAHAWLSKLYGEFYTGSH